jgi:hypothetical protein
MILLRLAVALAVLSPVSALAADLVFRDVAGSAGLFPAIAGIQGHGAGWGDIDGDGWVDLYVATFHRDQSPSNRLFRNDRGTFRVEDQPAVQISTRGTGVVFADLDNDGDVDLYVGSMPALEGSKLAQRTGHPVRGCSLFRNDGGKFTDISSNNGACPREFGGRSVCVLDFDSDNRLDLLVGEDPVTGYNGSQTRSTRLFRNVGYAQFEDASRSAGIPEGVPGLGVASADVNNDGRPDLFIAAHMGGNRLLLNQGGTFRESPGAAELFAWPGKGDDMLCGVAFGDVNRDGLLDIVLGPHTSTPWLKPEAPRLYLNRGITDGVPKYDDVTQAVGLVPLPMKCPHVELQDFDNDGWPDLSTSVVTFADGQVHPVIFRHLGLKDGLPRFEQKALAAIDFPTAEDLAVKRSGPFFEKMIREKKILYTAPGPTADFDNDGRLDMFLPSWWPEAPSLLLHNETAGGNWLQVEIRQAGANTQGIGARINLYRPGKRGERDALIGCRDVSVGYGYASGQPAITHFGLGELESADVEILFPNGRHGESIRANQRWRMDWFAK